MFVFSAGGRFVLFGRCKDVKRTEVKEQGPEGNYKGIC
jgi:hypothetical protein